MKKLRYLFKMLPLLFAAGLLFSCASEEEGDEFSDDSLSVDTMPVTQSKGFADENMTYKLPSPIELFLFMKQHDAKFVKDAANSADDYKTKYYTSKSKAINFGVYATDLAYSVVFEEYQKTLLYFKVTKSLADELNLVEGFDEKVMKRIDNNINNIDSLQEITSDAYWVACDYLENQNKTDLLSFIMIGSWIESVYIAVQTLDKYKADSPILKRGIAEQGLLLANLLEHLESRHANDPTFTELMEQLQDLQLAYDKLLDNPADTVITKEQFNEIATKIEKIRNNLVQ